MDFFLQHWRVAGTIIGRDLGPNLFQFKFETEQDLQSVLSEAPFHLKRWMLILQRWEPIVSDHFSVLIWITIHGIPLHYWTDVVLEAIGNELGPVETYDLERGRIRVLINGLKPLEMSLKISLSGELKQVELEYENLQKHCFLCYSLSLSHEKDNCPSRLAQSSLISATPTKMGISQTRTMDRLEADKQRLDAKKHNSLVQHQATEQGRPEYSRQWQSSSTRSYDWNQDKSFRFNYGARRDPNFKHSSLSSERSNPSRPPARDRLSFRREEDSVTNKEPQSRNNNCTPRSEWRPITRIPQSGTIPKPMYSLGSHTPSPRPPREGDVNHRSASPASKQKSGEGSIPSQERRSALKRLITTKRKGTSAPGWCSKYGIWQASRGSNTTVRRGATAAPIWRKQPTI